MKKIIAVSVALILINLFSLFSAFLIFLNQAAEESRDDYSFVCYCTKEHRKLIQNYADLLKENVRLSNGNR